MTNPEILSEQEKKMKAFWYIFNNKNGDQKDLMNISPDLLEDFASSGYIAYGLDSSATPRFKTTSFGKEYAREVYMAMSSNLAHDDLAELLAE